MHLLFLKVALRCQQEFQFDSKNVPIGEVGKQHRSTLQKEPTTEQNSESNPKAINNPKSLKKSVQTNSGLTKNDFEKQRKPIRRSQINTVLSIQVPDGLRKGYISCSQIAI